MQSPTAALKLLDSTSASISWNFITYANGYNVYEIINGKPVLLTENLNNLSYQVNNLSYEDHQYYVTSFSNSFGESQPSNIAIAKLIVDAEAPITTSNAPINWVTQSPLVVSLSATDNLTGVENTFYSLNDSNFTAGNSITVDKEGVNKLSFYSVDAVGNKESVQIIYIKIDKTAPVTTTNVPENWSNKDVTVNLTAADTQSGVVKTFYSVDGFDYLEGTSFTVKDEGIHKINFYSIDAAGNIEAVNMAEVKIDKTTPITANNVPENWSNKDVAVNLSAADTQSGVAKTFYSIDGFDCLEGTSFIVKDEGIHKINFYSIDAAGNIEAVNMVEVKIDTTAPVITMDFDKEYKLGTELQLTYNAKDNLSGIVDGKIVVCSPNDVTGKIVESNASMQLDKPGTYTVTVTVTDATGFSTKIEKQFVVYIPVIIEVTPKVIKGNSGIFTVRASLPVEYGTQGFDINTATLNGVKALTSNNGYNNQAKLGQFKFERSDFTWIPSEMIVEFRCYINGYLVVGQTTVKIQK